MPVQDYKDLRVWQRAIDLVTLIYAATQTFPDQEIYGLKSQLRRAAVSVQVISLRGKDVPQPVSFSTFLALLVVRFTRLKLRSTLRASSAF